MTAYSSRNPRLGAPALGVVAAVAVVLALAPVPAAAARKTAAPTARTPAPSPWVDAHVHLDPSRPAESVQAALRAMPEENATRIVFLPPPFTTDDPARYDAELLLPTARGHEDKLTVLGGGGSLNAMLHESVRTGDAGPEVRRKFREIAEQLLRDGAAGFGEMAAEHFQGATPYQSAPPDHPLLLLLADIAAERGVPIVLHMEALPKATTLRAVLRSPGQPRELRANIAAFERLLAHDPRARIVWAHAGWDNTGFRSPALCRRLLQAHPNLFMDVKLDPDRPGKNTPMPKRAKGSIDPKWLALFRAFPDRFVIGTDQHYPEPNARTQRWQAAATFLERLPADLRLRIGSDNATKLFKREAAASR